ncbi:uncharacterized protein MYCFIDRAFT_197801 [Pseudocercospora fijiensis CIRAD86]|uniref:SnoaL-like domain-containing protein n=1 Tax=Pseudocercospora fijiensis (strain CIRAD86) TaxID=383855 RepID=M2YT65_PSEFD|nr:uncharacterized protein MYCFIDRAFT_197801 [Pseudocercospora fijiensis CIRAD86]EME80935.1 hypothetical protein MYCFIDRAFT_197801 [Pseudocercospora fijiensis CIRAD86]
MDAPVLTTATSTAEDYRKLYRHYISSIQPDQSSTDLSILDALIHPKVIHNSLPLGLPGYKSLIHTNIISTGTRIKISNLLVDVEERTVCARFDGDEDDTDGRLKIGEVWSVVDEGSLRRNAVEGG